MLIYLIRHTRPDIAGGVCYGQSDIPLADSFESEKDEVLCKLRGLADPEVVYSSPLLRCKHLAAALAGDEVKTDGRLGEMSFGDWELGRWDDIDRGELDAWAADFVERPPPGGESLGTLYERVSLWMEQLLRLPHKTVAVVTHAGVIRCFHVYATGMALADVFEFSVDYGDVFKLEVPSADGHSSMVKL